MALQSFLRLRRLQRLGKLLVFALSASTISYFLFASSNLWVTIRHGGSKGGGVDDTTRATHKLNVHIWRSLCGSAIANLRKSLFFPRYPDEKKFTRELHVEDSTVDYGQRIFGFLHPPHSGSFRFAIASDDASELWLSANENPGKKQLIARVFVENASAWTGMNELNKYPEQISKEVKLRHGRKYYIEVLHKQGTGNGFVQVFWTNSDNNADFKLITSQYLSPYSYNTSVAAKKDAIRSVFSGRYRHEFLLKSSQARSKFLKFYSLPFISKNNYLPPCEYRSSFVPHARIYRYEGLKMITESSVYPRDDTAMAVDSGMIWTWQNRAADKEIIESVVNKIITSLRLNTTK